MSDDRTFIIAEIGNNHNGKLEKAIKMVDAAAAAKVDAVKIQSFRGLDIVSPKVKANEYPGWNVKEFEYWFQFLDTIALPLEDHQELIDYSHSKGLKFITTPVSPAIVGILEELKGIDGYKLASMDLNNIPLIEAMSKTRKPITMSTGMGALSEIQTAVEKFKRSNINILHCISDYPLQAKNAALTNISVLKKAFPDHTIGFSDHSLGHELTLCSLALGAKVIEKHITLDRNDTELAEHHFSLEPKELTEMVSWIRDIDYNLTQKDWQRSPQESEGKRKFRRSYHYKSNLLKGHLVQLEDLTFIRPGQGIDHKQIDDLLNKPLIKDIQAYSPCLLQDVN